MSNQQREAVAYWSSVLMKITMPLTGGLLIILYSGMKEEAEETRREFRHAIEKIETTTKDMQKTVNTTEGRIMVIESQIKRLDK